MAKLATRVAIVLLLVFLLLFAEGRRRAFVDDAEKENEEEFSGTIIDTEESASDADLNKAADSMLFACDPTKAAEDGCPGPAESRDPPPAPAPGPDASPATGERASLQTVSMNDVLIPNVKGVHYNLADNWFSCVPLSEYQNRAIRYLEIGAFYGANLISVANSYGVHPDSRFTVIDPWSDYADYAEYKGEIGSVFDVFLDNVESSGHSDKIVAKRGYSHEELLSLEDESFDIIYIDGNHEPEYVLEDAVLSFRKLKKGGVLIFDDYGWGGEFMTQMGIDAFLSGYHKRIRPLGMPCKTGSSCQVVVQKFYGKDW